MIALSGAVGVLADEKSRAPAPAADSGLLTIDQVDVGFDGNFKVGRWSPVMVHVTASRPLDVRLILEVADPDGSITSLPGNVQHVPQGETHALRGIFRSGRIDSSLRVVVREAASEGGVLASRQIHVSASPGANEMRQALTHAEPLIATLGKPAGFIDLDTASRGSTPETEAGENSKKTEAVIESRYHVARLAGPDELPADFAGYESLDLLAIAGRYDVDAKTSDAVRNWVRLGGHLVVAVGGKNDDYANSQLAKWIPVPVVGTSQLRDLSALESYVGKNVRIDLRGLRTVAAARLGPVDGIVDVRGIDGPILVQVPFGFGKVTFVALDISAEPFPAWNAAADFARQITLAGQPVHAEKSQFSRAKLTHTGITDIATQIHATQDVFPDVRRLSMWSVMGLLVLYLLIIGPLDYLIVHRVLRRPQLTWVTFPIIVAAAAAIAVWGASRTNGEKLDVNQLDLVDIDVQSNLVRARSWLTLYSPQTARYQVRVEPKSLGGERAFTPVSSFMRPPLSTPLAGPVRVAWSGVPENSYSGMYRLGGFEIARPPYSFAENASAIDNLPVNIWSTKELTATWHTGQENLVESDLSGSASGGLVGSVVHHLSAPIKDWVIAYGKMAYLPVANQFNPEAVLLRPGRPLQFSVNSQSIRRRNLSGFLTGLRRTVIEGSRSRDEKDDIKKDTYDPLGRNADEIVRMLTFYTKAGGKSFTTLENNDLRSLDLSSLLDLNRAVVFGKIDLPTAGLEINGRKTETHHGETYIRIVLPVKQMQSNIQAASTETR